jgi:Tfp pilus assembly protein PilV
MSPAICPNTPERGSALIVTLIMLVLLTVILGSAFSLSSTNGKSVANTQSRDEVVAAANAAIEQIVSSPFTNAPQAETIGVDINNDGINDYSVNVAQPTCVSASSVTPASLPLSSLSLPAAFSVSGQTYYDTVWDIDAQVQDPASGAAANVHQGVRVLLDQTQYQLVCP